MTAEEIEKQIESLGQFAAHYDLWAENYEIPLWEKDQLKQRSAKCRERQIELMREVPEEKKVPFFNGLLCALTIEAVCGAIICLGILIWSLFQ